MRKNMSFFFEDVDLYRHAEEIFLNSKMLIVFSRPNEEGNDNHRSGRSDEGSDGNDVG